MDQTRLLQAEMHATNGLLLDTRIAQNANHSCAFARNECRNCKRASDSCDLDHEHPGSVDTAKQETILLLAALVGVAMRNRRCRDKSRGRVDDLYSCGVGTPWPASHHAQGITIDCTMLVTTMMIRLISHLVAEFYFHSFIHGLAAVMFLHEEEEQEDLLAKKSAIGKGIHAQMADDDCCTITSDQC